jgi:hypothetical protein
VAHPLPEELCQRLKSQGSLAALDGLDEDTKAVRYRSPLGRRLASADSLHLPFALRLSEGQDRLLHAWLALDRLRGLSFLQRRVAPGLPAWTACAKSVDNLLIQAHGDLLFGRLLVGATRSTKIRHGGRHTATRRDRALPPVDYGLTGRALAHGRFGGSNLGRTKAR